MSERVVTFYECDHMRPVVLVDEVWHHLIPRGRIGGPCGSTIAYEQKAVTSDQHVLSLLVAAPDSGRDAEPE